MPRRIALSLALAAVLLTPGPGIAAPAQQQPQFAPSPTPCADPLLTSDIATSDRVRREHADAAELRGNYLQRVRQMDAPAREAEAAILRRMVAGMDREHRRYSETNDRLELLAQVYQRSLVNEPVNWDATSYGQRVVSSRIAEANAAGALVIFRRVCAAGGTHAAAIAEINAPRLEQERERALNGLDERNGVSPTPTGLITGRYASGDGNLDIRESGGLVVGTYAQDAGKLTGTGSGSAFQGYWIESRSLRRCDTERDGSPYWGQVNWTFTRAGFTGTWGYCDGPLDRTSWTGTRQ